MYRKIKYLLIILFSTIFCSDFALSETNFDFFFKNADHYKDVIVSEVLSADTIRLEGKIGEKGEIIKLIGLRAPNPPKRKTKDIKRDDMGLVISEPVSPLSPIEERAFVFVQELLEGQHVQLEFDEQKMTDDHSTWAYVFLLNDDTFVNAEILRYGFASLSIRPPNTKYANKLREAYQEANAEKRGLQGQ